MPSYNNQTFGFQKANIAMKEPNISVILQRCRMKVFQHPAGSRPFFVKSFAEEEGP